MLKSDERKFASLNESESFDDLEGEFLEKLDTKQSIAQQKIWHDDAESKSFFKKNLNSLIVLFGEKL